MAKFIGMMSGTSMDGIDVALIEADGETIESIGPTSFSAYTDKDRSVLRQALDKARLLRSRTFDDAAIVNADALVTRRHVEALTAFLAENGLDPADIEAVGFHGQTITHKPETGLTVQIGDPAVLAGKTGLTVVADLRQADMAAGGQGAPLVPVYHHALVAMAGLPTPAVVFNIGGVGNLTYVGAPLMAFDTGPGNALLDDWVDAARPGERDEDGAVSAAGVVNSDALDCLLDNNYFLEMPPKSLDRDAFSLSPLKGLSLEDGAATLAAFTAETQARALAFLPASPEIAIVCGGGRHNPTIMRELTERLEPPVKSAEDVGWRGDFVEAEAFAYLAARSLTGLPLTFPETTGVAAPATGGIVFPPNANRR